MNNQSKKLFATAKKILVGGVNFPVRSFSSVGGHPLFIKKAKGPYLYTEDNKKYIDYVLSWGPCILGHAHPKIVKAIQKAASKGTSYGAPSELETILATDIQSLMPSIEKIRFVNSGTEAAMSAIRLARGATNRPLILKFNGCYHGHADPFLVAAGSGNLTLSKPDSDGVLKSTSEQTLVCEYNDHKQLAHIFKTYGKHIAAIILEPIAGNMGVIKAHETFITAIKKCCKSYGSLLIFDEVMTGFRCHLNGAQALLDCKPDITLLGKVIGGGLPCGAYGGRSELMNLMAPEGPIYQAGTLSGNPIAMKAGIETLYQLTHENKFQTALEASNTLCANIKYLIQKKKHPYSVQQVGTMFTLFFRKGPIHNLNDVKKSNISEFPIFFHNLLNHGIYWPPSPYEACFTSSTHKKIHIKKTLSAINKTLK